MSGFSFLFRYEGLEEVSYTPSVSKNMISNTNYIAVNNMIDKFDDDKIFYDDDEYLIILDGVVLNKSKLIINSDAISWPKCILEKYKRDNCFFNQLRGSFSGIIYDKKSDTVLSFSDHIGTKFIYYVKEQGFIFITSIISEAYSFLKQNNIPYSLTKDGAYSLLSYGYMLEDRTLCDKIKKIIPGCYIKITSDIVTVKRYCLLDNTPDCTLTEDEAIELIDIEFRKAVALEFEKDKEYGYKHLVALSAGLDSRMTCWVAHKMGYTNQLNFTFSQSDYWDETIPKKIASDLKHEWLFKALDNGLWLYDIDDVTKVTGGNVLYYGLAHGNSLYKYLNFKDLGMIHSGQLGDVIVGTWFSSKDSTLKFQLGDGAYSTKYLSNMKDYRLEEYANQEIAKFYHRGFNGTNNGQLLEMEYSETCSPFMNWDFMQAVIKIPVELRYGHNIYKKWILKKYPGAAKYVWEKIGCRIDSKYRFINYKDKSVNIFDIHNKIIKKIRRRIGIVDNKDMNPIVFYLLTNHELAKYIDNYFDDNLYKVFDDNLKQVLIEIRNGKNYIEKIQAISLLSSLKLFY